MSTPSTTESELIKIRQCQGLCFVVIVYIQGMIFCPCYDFCWKSCFFFVGKVLEIYDPKLFAYQNILALCTLCLETAPRRKRFWKYFWGGAEVIFSGQGRAVLKVLRGWASQGTLFQAMTCAPAHP